MKFSVRIDFDSDIDKVMTLKVYKEREGFLDKEIEERDFSYVSDMVAFLDGYLSCIIDDIHYKVFVKVV